MIDHPLPWVSPLINQEIRDFFLKNGKLLTYRKGSVIISENQHLNKLFYLKSGLLGNSIVYNNLSKAFIMCGIKIPGHIMGCTAFLTKDTAPVHIAALLRSEVLCVTFDDMQNFLQQDSSLEDYFKRYCGRCLRSEVDAMLAISTAHAEERFWIVHASLFLALNIAIEDLWVKLPFKLTRQSISFLLYVSIQTVDRLYSAIMKNGEMIKIDGVQYLSSAKIKEGLNWINERRGVGG